MPTRKQQQKTKPLNNFRWADISRYAYREYYCKNMKYRINIYIYYIPPPLTVHFPTVIEMVEMVEIVDRRVGKRSVERVRYVINNLLHFVIVKYGVISLVLCISTRLRLVTILTLLVKYLVIYPV